MSIKTQAIAISLTNRPVAIMHLIVSTPIRNFSAEAAESNGFILSPNGLLWERSLTDAIIVAEIARDPNLVGVTSWQRITDTDIPLDRANRAGWSLGNDKIVVTPPTKPTTSQRIDAAFPQTDVARVIFEALFELSNDVRALKGQAAITRVQLRDWLKSKLPA